MRNELKILFGEHVIIIIFFLFYNDISTNIQYRSMVNAGVKRWSSTSFIKKKKIENMRGYIE